MAAIIRVGDDCNCCPDPHTPPTDCECPCPNVLSCFAADLGAASGCHPNGVVTPIRNDVSNTCSWAGYIDMSACGCSSFGTILQLVWGCVPPYLDEAGWFLGIGHPSFCFPSGPIDATHFYGHMWRCWPDDFSCTTGGVFRRITRARLSDGTIYDLVSPFPAGLPFTIAVTGIPCPP